MVCHGIAVHLPEDVDELIERTGGAAGIEYSQARFAEYECIFGRGVTLAGDFLEMLGQNGADLTAHQLQIHAADQIQIGELFRNRIFGQIGVDPRGKIVGIFRDNVRVAEKVLVQMEEQ